MRRGGWGLWLPALVLLSAALAYIGVYALGSRGPGETAQAEAYVWRDSVTLTGLVLRTEQTVTDPRPGVRLTALPGRRVAAGEALGVAYDTGDEYFRAGLLLRLRGELAARTEKRTGLEELKESASAFTQALARGDLPALAAAAAAISPRPGDLDAPMLVREIAALESAGAEEWVLRAPESGYFLPGPWEQEALTPAMAGKLTCEEIIKALQGPAGPVTGAGRLVTGADWVFAAPAAPAVAERFRPGEAAVLTLAGETVEARVLRVVEDAAGGAVLFRCATGLGRVLEARTVTMEAEFDRRQGLLLPPEAVHTGEDGEIFVYRLAETLPQREAVRVILDLPEGTLVESDALRAGDTVLLGEP